MTRTLPAAFLIAGALILLHVGTCAAAAQADQLPVPPIPPAHPPLADIAPVPDPDAHAPITVASSEPSVDIRLYRNKTYDPSMGFAPGSQYQTSEERKPIQTPGFSISVPLR